MQRSCDQCGELYEFRARSSRFCEAKCRRAAHRGVPAVRPTVRSRTVAPAGPDGPAAPTPGSGVLEAATRAELTALGRECTAAGVAALALANLIDARQDPGSALAAMTREWRAAFGEATSNATRQDSGLDELADELARRRGRRGA